MKKPFIAVIVMLVILGTAIILGAAANRHAEKVAAAQETDTVSSGAVTAKNLPPAIRKVKLVKPQPTLRYRLKPFKAMESFKQDNLKKLPRYLARYKFTAGVLVDLESRQVIWEKQSLRPVPVASLSKLMTIYTAFEELERRSELALDDKVTVSKNSCAVAPVRINFKPGDQIKLNDLFIYAMLKSANDAAYLIAEHFGHGYEDRFIALMNLKARAVGMRSSSFVNANGLPIYPAGGQGKTLMNMASCQDMALLIEQIHNYPMITRYTRARTLNTPRGVINNGNRLLGTVKGMEGMKTGYTNAAGHCLAFSCRRNGRRLVGIVTGFRKRQNCFDFTAQLLEWGFKTPPGK